MATSGALGIRERAVLGATIELLERTLKRLEGAPEYARERVRQERAARPDVPFFVELAVELGAMESQVSMAAIEVKVALGSLKELRDILAGEEGNS